MGNYTLMIAIGPEVSAYQIYSIIINRTTILKIETININNYNLCLSFSPQANSKYRRGISQATAKLDLASIYSNSLTSPHFIIFRSPIDF